MKRGVIWVILTCIMVTSLVLASCNTSATTSGTTSTTKTTTTSVTTSSTTSTATSTSATTSVTTTTTTVAAHWWDSLTPQYGGEAVSRMTSDPVIWDPYGGGMSQTSFMIGMECYIQRIFCYKYTTEPTVFNFGTTYIPPEYMSGHMLTGWEMPDPVTFVAYLRSDVYWQNIPPANGRQFVASDVAYHYNRELGLGDGFTKPAPVYVGSASFAPLISVTCPDKFTVVWKWKDGTSPLSIVTTLLISTPQNVIECPDAVKLWGDLNDWHHSIGTGPYMVADYVSSSSITFVKNPNYWGFDERWPQNRLPYITKRTYLIIVNSATALAAMRTGKIDSLGVSATDAASMKQAHPELVLTTTPAGLILSVDPMNNKAPFNDIRVRIAMQKAIDMPTIANTYYAGTAIPYPAALTQNQMAASGWGVPYSNWPQALKDEYAYDVPAAKKLLADAGYANGFQTSCVIKASADKDLYLIAQSMFAVIGINMSISVMDDASWTNFVINSKKCDALAARQEGIIGRTTDPFTQLKQFIPINSTDYIGIDDPKINGWFDQAMAAKSIDEVKQILIAENEYIARQHFVVSLTQPSSFGLHWPWLKGDAPGASGIFPNGNWIDQDVKKSLGH